MIMEPDFDGLDTYKEILKTKPQQKAIVVSGFSSSERVEELIRLGASGYLRKPYSMEGIASAVHSALHPTPIDPQREAAIPAQAMST